MFRSIIRIALLASLALGTARGTTFLTLQSTYLGDGWFQYQMNVMDDPFFTEADVTSLQINFTNQIDQIGDSTNWSFGQFDIGFSTWEWEFTNGIPARPYTKTFLMRSSETSFRLSNITNFDGALLTLSLYLAGYFPGANNSVYAVNVVGYASLPCLMPCSPEQADGSPTNYTFTLKLLPDVSINSLIQESGMIEGVDFNWNSPSTFVLQGSSDLSHWTNISYLWSYPPETTWMADGPLNEFGQFFRLLLVADGHVDDSQLPPLSSNVLLSPKNVSKSSVSTSQVPVTGCKPANGKLVISIATQSGQTYQVQALDSLQVVRQTQTVTAQGTSATVTFDAATLPTPVFFKATAAAVQ